MRWMTHQAGAVFAALLLQFSPPGILLGFCASILPDVLDQKLAARGRTARQRQKIFNAVHRGSTHWFGWWLAMFLACGFIMSPLMRDLAAAVALGGLTHVALDMFTPRGVPLFPLGRRGCVSLHFCSTGSWQEYLVLAFFVCGCLFLLAWRYDSAKQLERVLM